MSLADLRTEYQRQGLSETDVEPDPIVQFGVWLEQALAAKLPEPNAITLATVGADGRPSARMVLLKGVDTGFIFFTNYGSRKGQELAAHPYAALISYWAEMERQVRVEGRVEQLDPAASDTYFHSRPRGSQLGAVASTQSQVVASREALDRRLQELTTRYEGQEVPRPLHWGGYRVVPDRIEFWQGRRNRMHDRLCYERQPDGAWRMVRLEP
jgi:pyridoxamine 5'-phosphate oxidase